MYKFGICLASAQKAYKGTAFFGIMQIYGDFLTVFVAKLGFVVRLVLVAMTAALQHWATAHPHSPLPSLAWWGPL